MNIQEYKDLNLRPGTIHSIHWKRELNNTEVLKDFRGRVVYKEIYIGEIFVVN